ncbi:MAG TPA: ferritin [bacterium]|nr:ferritin [bacterium]HPN44316.1 ferritin [bacterium]
MISKAMEKALNGQINKETYSAYLYFAMAAYFDSENLEGMAGFMKVQAQEEMGHAMKFYNYINEQGGRVTLDAIDKPQASYKNPLEIFQLSLKHEKFITDSINKLMDQAIKENDHATKEFLHWFVKEQVEEEDHMAKIVSKLERVGESGQGLLIMDAQLGSRK